jgi:hypothetical protein
VIRLRQPERLVVLLVFMVLSIVFVSQVFAHAPLAPGNNESLETATHVSDPTKSWAIYAELHEGGEAQYYRFNISQGERIHVGLLKSTSPADGDFFPSFVLMGPNLISNGMMPKYVNLPKGAGSMIIEGKNPTRATYEAFAPSAFFQLADLAMAAPASGTYFVAVFENSQGGHYGLAVGDRESFTLSEWTLTPLSVLSIRSWSGQSTVIQFGPTATVLVLGIAILLSRRGIHRGPRSFFHWAEAVAGLLFLASGFTVITQMLIALTFAPLGPDAFVTIILAIVPIMMGIFAIRFALRKTVSGRTRLNMAILGVLALFAWAGFVVGPILAVIASFTPYSGAEPTN